MGRRKKITLTPEQKDEIKAIWRTGQFTQKEVAERFGVAHTTILRICKKTKKDLKKITDKKISAEVEIAKHITPKQKLTVDEMLEAKTQDAIAAHHNARYIMEFTMEKLKKLGKKDVSFSDLSKLQQQAQKFKDTTVGREAANIININNNKDEKKVIVLPSNGFEAGKVIIDAEIIED